MTLRERIADWISGGALRKARSTPPYTIAKSARFRLALHQIAAMETPNANATVKRMARTAREAVK